MASKGMTKERLDEIRAGRYFKAGKVIIELCDEVLLLRQWLESTKHVMEQKHKELEWYKKGEDEQE